MTFINHNLLLEYAHLFKRRKSTMDREPVSDATDDSDDEVGIAADEDEILDDPKSSSFTFEDFYD